MNTDPFYTSVAQVGDTILYLGRDKNGNRISQKGSFKPTLYKKCHIPTGWKTIKGDHVEPVKPGLIADCKQFLRQNANNPDIFGITNYTAQFIHKKHPTQPTFDFSKLSIVNLDIEIESEKGWAKPENPTERVNVVTIKHKGKTYVFGLGQYNIPGAECQVFTEEVPLLEAFLTKWQELEPDIVTGWNIQMFDIPYLVRRMNEVLPKDQVGDKKLNRSRLLSPWKKLKETAITWFGKENLAYTILGVSQLDYMRVYKIFMLTARESYTLDYISRYELGKDIGKVDWKKKYPSMKDFYTQNFQEFVEYNIQDVELIVLLEKKLRFLEMVTSMAYWCRINFEDTFNQTRIWDSLIYHHLTERKIVVPMKVHTSKDEKFKGAYVKPSTVGLHSWVCSFDATSLYPMSQIQWNISPDTLVEPQDIPLPVKQLLDKTNVNSLLAKKVDTSILKEYGMCVTPNAQVFRTDKRGFMGEILSSLFIKRKNAKDTMLAAKTEIEALKVELVKTTDPADIQLMNDEIARLKEIAARNAVEQSSAKVTLVSAFGASGNQFFRYYDLRIAEGITYSGQYVIRSIINALEKFFNSLLKEANPNARPYEFTIASDTDSAYIRLGEIVDILVPDGTPEEKLEFVEMFCRDVIAPELKLISDDLGEYTNAFDRKISFKREVICDKAIWLGSKNYFLNILTDEEGRLSSPSIKTKGLESVKSSTPQICKDALIRCTQLVLTKTNEDLQGYVSAFKQEFFAAPPEIVSAPSGTNNLTKWQDPKTGLAIKKTPFHIKGALIYNQLLIKRGLQTVLPPIISGDKVRVMALREPNVSGSKVISFPKTLPPEFLLHDSLDYTAQYEKKFMKPLMRILSVIHWQPVKVPKFTAEDW